MMGEGELDLNGKRVNLTTSLKQSFSLVGSTVNNHCVSRTSLFPHIFF